MTITTAPATAAITMTPTTMAATIRAVLSSEFPGGFCPAALLLGDAGALGVDRGLGVDREPGVGEGPALPLRFPRALS